MSVTGTWPTATDYASAVQQPALSFVPEELKTAVFERGVFDLPRSAGGASTVVFRARTNGRDIAVRCFTTGGGSRARYEALHNHLRRFPVPAMAEARWIDGALLVRGTPWPVVSMEWVEGGNLDSHVAQQLDKPAGLRALAERWRVLMAGLRSAQLAHGDLQQGNVMVDQDGALRLVDFDSVWVPAASGNPPEEVGNPHFQHPQRVRSGYWGEHVDAFSAFVIYLSLRALAAERSLWDFNNGQNLVLTAEDYQPDRVGHGPVWDRLAGSQDTEVGELAQILQGLCRQAVDTATDLETILATGSPGPSAGAGGTPTRIWWKQGAARGEPPRVTLPAATAPPPPTGREWWQQHVAASGATAQPAPSAPAASPPPQPSPPRTSPERPRQWWKTEVDTAGSRATGSRATPPTPSKPTPPSSPPPPKREGVGSAVVVVLAVVVFLWLLLAAIDSLFGG